MSDDASQRLDELKLLWESDPSSKVYLQLASAYRQKGQLDKAIEVLETSLQHRPRDPRGRVALARCKMETSDFSTAAELLEDVIRMDAAHVEANKQLLECYLRLGDAPKAEERLGIYRLLNDRDPELDHLEYRLQSIEGGDSDSAPSGDGEATDVAAADEAAKTREVFMEPAMQPPSPPAASPEPSDSPSQPAPPAPAAVPDVLETTAPGSDAGDDRQDAAEADDATDAGNAEHRPIPGLPAMKFAVAGRDEETVEPPAPEDSPPAHEEAELQQAAAEPEESPAQPVESSPEPPAVESFEAVESVGTTAEAVEASDPTPTPATESRVTPPAGDELFDLAPEPAPAGDDEEWGDDLFDLAPPSATDEVDDLGGLWDQTEVVDLDDEEEDEAELAAAPAAEPESVQADADEDEDLDADAAAAEEKATATLGLLYLRQGHLDEAETILRTVLDAEPDNEAALAGMQQLESQRAAREVEAEPEPVPEDASKATPAVASPLTAEVLLGRVALEGGVPDDATGRKIAVLQQYLQHIRTASRDHVH